MTFHQGQRVRIRENQFQGTVKKKLMSLDNVYIVVIESASPIEDRLVRGDDLEVLPEGD